MIAALKYIFHSANHAYAIHGAKLHHMSLAANQLIRATSWTDFMLWLQQNQPRDHQPRNRVVEDVNSTNSSNTRKAEIPHLPPISFNTQARHSSSRAHRKTKQREKQETWASIRVRIQLLTPRSPPRGFKIKLNETINYLCTSAGGKRSVENGILVAGLYKLPKALSLYRRYV